jgi:PAS domain S-box-containing protein
MTQKIKQLLVYLLYAGIAFGGYAAFFILFRPVIGDSVAIFSFMPALLIAWMWGIKRGVIAGVAADILTLALFHVDGDKCLDFTSLKLRLPGFIAIVIIAAIVGYMRELRQRLKKELEQKIKTEAGLRENESRFKAIFEGSTDALMLFSEQSFFDCNHRTLELFGFKSKEEFTRVHPADISPPNQPDGRESFPAAQERIKTAFEKGSNRFEWIHRRKNGEDFPAEVLLSAFVLSGKNVLQATVRDITERKRVEQKLARWEDNFRTMFEASTDAMFLIPTEGDRFLEVNNTMCRMSGYSREELFALKPRDIIIPPKTPEVENYRSKLMQKGTAGSMEVSQVLKKDGSMLQVLMSAQTISWKGIIVIFGSIRDITPMRRMQDQLRQKNVEILEFTDTIVHDLKKPLTAMKTICDMTKTNAATSGNPDFIEMVDIGAESIRYMQEMLDDLLACAKLEAGTQELALEEVRCRELVDQAVHRLKYAIDEKQIDVEINGDDLCVRADPKQFTRVFMNLIGNAINYIGEKPGKKISVGWEQIGGSTVFSVSDNGIGIPQETQAQLFTKFKRGTNVSGISGTGLGLSIVKGMILAHGGRIWFESREGEGTAFHFTLG